MVIFTRSGTLHRWHASEIFKYVILLIAIINVRQVSITEIGLSIFVLKMYHLVIQVILEPERTLLIAHPTVNTEPLKHMFGIALLVLVKDREEKYLIGAIPT